MSINFFIFLLIFAVTLFKMPTASAQRREPRCLNPPLEGWPQPTNCNFGIIHDVCGKPSCAMGPGEFCKYKRFSTSNCSDGLYCHCSRCMGCSLINYNCYETSCVYVMPRRRKR